MANEEPRGAWRILAESGFCGGNAEQTALRADHIFGGNLNSELCPTNTVTICEEDLNGLLRKASMDEMGGFELFYKIVLWKQVIKTIILIILAL
ncbi:MAG: hypothetical protein HZB09_00930 [Candidatus Yonathbacteria bacterium]|nr:hypothetical protein [Candidatus Yonathbacteria bacterium]